MLRMEDAEVRAPELTAVAGESEWLDAIAGDAASRIATAGGCCTRGEAAAVAYVGRAPCVTMVAADSDDTGAGEGCVPGDAAGDMVLATARPCVSNRWAAGRERQHCWWYLFRQWAHFRHVSMRPMGAWQCEQGVAFMLKRGCGWSM